MSRTAHARKPATEKRALCRDLVGKRAVVKWRGESLMDSGTRVCIDGTWRGKLAGAIGFGSPYACWFSRDQIGIIEEPKTSFAVCADCARRWQTLPIPTFKITPDQPECWTCGKVMR